MAGGCAVPHSLKISAQVTGLAGQQTVLFTANGLLHLHTLPHVSRILFCCAADRIAGYTDLIFRQLFDKESSTYTYLLADPVSKEALLIDPVLEQVSRQQATVGGGASGPWEGGCRRGAHGGGGWIAPQHCK
jgi:hypothetical protein